MTTDRTIHPKILATATQLPPYTKDTAEILAYMEEFLKGESERFRQKVLRIFKYAQVDRRYSIMPAEEVFTPTSFEEKNDRYIKESIDLAEKVLRKALDNAGMQPDELDYLITVSCTGFMIPSVDAYLINRLRLREDIVRLPVTEMGCVAGISALIYAQQFLNAYPDKKAAVVAVESPTSTFQHGDMSLTNMVSAAIFGDGASCVILGNTDEPAPALIDSEMFHFYDEEEMMGYKVRNTGFEMVLDVEVPEKIAERFDEIIHPFLAKNELDISDIDHLIFHPGGKKIVKMVDQLFGKLGKDISITREVLRKYGNMSSATVLFVLDEFMKMKPKIGERGLMLSFGPGFSAQRILLEWR